jgi:chromate reductase, NAD(P)H dehydrogenase (quinone)
VTLKFLIFLGSTRDSTPPQPARLGLRVARACALQINQETNFAELIDPLDYKLTPIFKPHFAYAQGKAPIRLESLANHIESADGYAW